MLEYLYLLQGNQIHGTSKLRTLILELGLSYRRWITDGEEQDISYMNEKYDLINEVIFEEMTDILKRFSKEEEFYTI